jgi:transcription initiation factor IIF auxiliary subunit
VRSSSWALATFVLISSLQISSAVAQKTPASRISVENDSTYLGRRNGRDWWSWTIYIRGPDQEISMVQCVTYHLHPTFHPPNIQICNQGGDPAHAFPLVRRGWGTFNIIADVEKDDGTVLRLPHTLRFVQPQPPSANPDNDSPTATTATTADDEACRKYPLLCER